MKKFIVLALAIILLITPLPIKSAGENYAEELMWTNGLAQSVVNSDSECIATGFVHSFSTPYLDIRPALIKALGTKDKVQVKISVGIRATFQGNGAYTTSCNLILRGGSNLKLSADEWEKAYSATLNGDEPLFTYAVPNEMYVFTDNTVAVNSTDWSYVTVSLTVTRNQLYSDHISNWNLCIDGLKLDSPIVSLSFKNTSVTVSDGAEIPVRRTPSVVRTEAPAAGQISLLTPTATPTAAPDADGFGDLKEAIKATLTVAAVIICIMLPVYVLTNRASKKRR